MSLADGWTPPTADEEPPESSGAAASTSSVSDDPSPEQVAADLPEAEMGPKP